MIELDVSRWNMKPFAHQVIGVRFLLKNTVGAILDEPGSGKSAQFVNAACHLWEGKQIDTGIIVCPANVKPTWLANEVGQIDTHAFVPSYVEEYDATNTSLIKPIKTGLHWVVVSFEFLRSGSNLDYLIRQLRGRRNMVVFDEATSIKRHNAKQTVAARDLREICRRAYLATGTPITNNIGDLYAPFAVLDKQIIGSVNYWAFRNRYMVMGGWKNKQVIGYRNVEEVQKKVAPYVLRRLKEDCLDLPPKMYNVMEVPLCEKTWRAYQDFKNEMFTMLDSSTPVMTTNTMVKITRLAQLTSGMIGGLRASLKLAEAMGLRMNENLDFNDLETSQKLSDMVQEDLQVISHEKHEWIAEWFENQLEEQAINFKTIIWARFNKEQELLRDAILRRVPGARIMRIYGGQKKLERENVITEFNSSASKPVALIAQPQAGGIGLNLQADCSWAVYASNDYNLLTRLQSEDRIHRAGQRASVVNYIDVLAVGPQGQKTIDHAIKKALAVKNDFAICTTAYWRAELAA